MKDVQAREEAFRPQKSTSSTSKYEILLFYIFLCHFSPPGSGSRDPLKPGSTTLPKTARKQLTYLPKDITGTNVFRRRWVWKYDKE
jgi:hypothetical protein